MIELMRERIVIQKSTTENDGNGNHTLMWSDYHKCFAYANGLSGKEYYAAAQTNARDEISFGVRYCKKLSGLTADHYRILFRGKHYNISHVDNVQFQNKTLKIRAAEEKR